MLEDYVAIDLEMTGLRAKTDRILELGAVRVRGGNVKDTFSALIRQRDKIPDEIIKLTGITDEMAAAGEESDEALEAFFLFVGEEVLVGQNIIFDYSFLKQWAVNHSYPFERKAVDTLKLARKFLPEEEKKNLENLCRYFQIERRSAHRALDDALETAEIFEKLKERYGEGDKAAFEPKPLQYRAKKQSPAMPKQIRYLKQYAAYYQIELPESLEGMTKSQASRLTDKLIAQYGKLPRSARI